MGEDVDKAAQRLAVTLALRRCFAASHSRVDLSSTVRETSIRFMTLPSLGRSLAIFGMAMALSGSRAFAGPPFLTDDTDVVDFRHWEIDLFSQGTQIRGSDSAALPGVEIDYGLLPNLETDVNFSENVTGPDPTHTKLGLSDLELSGEYRFITAANGDWFPDVAVFPTIEVPIGNQKLGFSTGHAQLFLPVWLEKDFGAWSIYGGGGYWINPGADNKNYRFFGISPWRQITDRLQLGVELFHQTASADSVPASTGFNVGGIYDISDRWHVLASAGRGLQNSPATNKFSYYLGLQLTF